MICLSTIYQLPYFLNLKRPKECNRKFIWCSVDHKLNIISDNPGKKIPVSLQSTQMTKREKHCNYKTKILRLIDVYFGVDNLLYTWRKTSHCVCIVRWLLPFKIVHGLILAVVYFSLIPFVLIWFCQKHFKLNQIACVTNFLCYMKLDLIKIIKE